MGSVDQGDVKAHVLNLTRQKVRKWYRKQLLFCIETAVINSYWNYNLDPRYKAENFKDWDNKFIAELLNISPNYRIYNTPKNRLRDLASSATSSRKKRKLSHQKRETPKRLHRSKSSPYGTATKAGLNCPGRDNLTAFLRFTPAEGSACKTNPSGARRMCSFCGKKKTMYTCSACKQSFCMTPPCGLTIPMSNPPRKFPSNGPFCWQRVHGFDTFDGLME